MSLRLLNASSWAAREAVQRREGARVGVIHFGPGAFFRAHQAWYFDRLLERDKRWGIAGVSLKSPGVRDALVPQDGLYVLAELEREPRFEVVGSLLQVLVAAEDPEAVLSLMASPDVGVITSTVTEKGYCLGAGGGLDFGHPDIVHDLADPRSPVSLIGYMVEGLRRRRAAGLTPPVVISCDNLSGNGALFKAAVVALAARSEPDLAGWIEAEAIFPRTMVDSITPATDEALRQRVQAELDVIDAWPIQRERFTQWVVEDILPPSAPDLASVGVQLTSDVAGFERAKLRLLNGSHSSLAYMGLLRGHRTVAQAMGDAELAGFVRKLMTSDVAPSLRPTEGLDVPVYIEAVLDRFRNPAIEHTLAQIAWDGSQKLPIRLLGTAADALAAGRPVERLARPIAAWMAFVSRQARGGVEIVDPLAAQLAALGKACTGDPVADGTRFLALPQMFAPELAADAQFRTAIFEAYATEAAFATLGTEP